MIFRQTNSHNIFANLLMSDVLNDKCRESDKVEKSFDSEANNRSRIRSTILAIALLNSFLLFGDFDYYKQGKQRKVCLAKDISPRQVLGVLNGGDHLVHCEKGRQVCSVRTEIEKLKDFD